MCSVIFDVDKGQTLQDLWPPDCLSEEDKAAVAFHAFPVGGVFLLHHPLKQIPAASHRHSSAFHLATARGRAKQPCFPDYLAVCWHVILPDLLAGLPVHGAVHPQCHQGQVSPLPAHATVLAGASFGCCGFPASVCAHAAGLGRPSALAQGARCATAAACCLLSVCACLPACSSFTFRIKREPETLDASGMPEFLYG